MYRYEDINILKTNIGKIKDDAIRIYKTTYEPTLEEYKKVSTVILKFIKDKKKIIYGGYAQNKLIEHKNIDDAFYKDIDTADIEFYSHEPLKDLIELCNLLHESNFKYIQGQDAVHLGSYKIFVNFINYCDISYLSKNICDKAPYIELNGLRLIHPTFMYVDVYRVFSDPMTSYYRLDKTFDRFIKLIKHYPIVSENNKIIIKKHNIDMNYIRKKIIHNSKLIVIGVYAYNYFLKKTDGNVLDINYYELISSNIVNDGKIILDKLNKLYPNKITIKQYYPFYEFFDQKIEFLYENNVIIKLYGNNHRCIVYNYSEKKKCYFGTFQLVYLYLLSNYIYFLISNKNIEATNYLNMAINLNNVKNKYLDANNKTVLDNTVFKEFTMKCLGEPVDLIREGRLSTRKGKSTRFNYYPDKSKNKDIKIPDFNEIVNNKYFIIKKKIL
jgi:hypothetical protein